MLSKSADNEVEVVKGAIDMIQRHTCLNFKRVYTITELYRSDPDLLDIITFVESGEYFRWDLCFWILFELISFEFVCNYIKQMKLMSLTKVNSFVPVLSKYGDPCMNIGTTSVTTHWMYNLMV